MSLKTERVLFRTLLMLIQCQFVILQQSQCLVTNDNNGPPAFPGGYGRIGLEITRQQQAIFASYKLNCCGNITEWGVDVNTGFSSGPNDRSGKYSLDLQVWRPSPTVDDSTGAGCYSLVGNNRFIAISPIISPGVAIVIPSPQDYIPFQPGDVLGVYVENATVHTDGTPDGVVVLTTYSTTSFTNDLVWYASIAPAMATSQNGDCPYSVGSSGGVLSTLVRGAPVISISTVTYSCPPLPSMATAQPTPPPNPTTDTNEETPPTTTQQIIIMPSLITPSSDGPSGGNIVPSLITPSSDGLSGGNIVPSLITPSSDSPLGGSSENTVPSRSISAIVASIVVSLFIMILIATVVIIAIVVKFKQSAKKGVSSSAHATGTKSYRQTESDATYDYIRDESCAPNMGIRSISNRMYDERELYHKLGPSAGEGGATSSEEIELRQVEVGHSTLPHVYHYLESIMSLPGGVQNTREGQPPVNGKSPSQANQEPTNSEAPQQQVVETDVFDRAGIYVPTAEERANRAENHYQLNKPKTYNKLKFFVKDQIYWAPATTTSDLYSQLASKKYREIPRNQLFIQQQRLGSGQFGDVSKALWCISGTTKELAIKTLKPDSKEEDKVKFLQEAAIMGQFSHPNVVKLYGVVTVGEPIMICIELMANGDLSKHLCSITPGEQNQMLEKQFLQFSRQIASGMKYLSMKSFVHRDLAARNILLDKCFACKIGDFGLARDLMNETYYTPKASGGMIPVKWTAPEALLYKKYSTDSDVWSYGMVLFEIWSVGKKPFSQHTNNQVLKLVQTGHCQPPPPGCPRAIYKLMVDCWNKEHQLRPSFEVICTYLQQPIAKLLYCSRQDAGNVNNLGAELEEATQQYMDLQESYVHYEAV